MHTLARRQCDDLTVIQKRVQADQHAGICDAAGLLELTDISVPDRFNERGVHIADALAMLLFLHRKASNRDLEELLEDVILGLVIVVLARQCHIDRGRMHDDIRDFR